MVQVPTNMHIPLSPRDRWLRLLFSRLIVAIKRRADCFSVAAVVADRKRCRSFRL